MGTLGRVCVDLGLRDARRGTWEGVQDIKYWDTGTLMILKRIDIILCVETSVNRIQFYVFNLTV